MPGPDESLGRAVAIDHGTGVVAHDHALHDLVEGGGQPGGALLGLGQPPRSPTDVLGELSPRPEPAPWTAHGLTAAAMDGRFSVDTAPGHRRRRGPLSGAGGQ